MHARTEQRKTCRDCITLNSSVCVYRNETKLCTRVAQGKILTVTERFSEFNSYNACNDVIDGEKSNLQACSFKKTFCHCVGTVERSLLTKLEGLTR